MTKITHIAAVAILSLSGAVFAGAAGNPAISGAGLSLSGIQIPSPETPRNNQWITLRKITVNEAQPDMDDMLVGVIRHGEDINKVVKELTEAGFKTKAAHDTLGGYLVFVDVTGLDAADYAVGLARYYYVDEVRVGRKVYGRIFGTPGSFSRGRYNQQNHALRKIHPSPAAGADNILLLKLAAEPGLRAIAEDLAGNGFKVTILGDRVITADVSGLDAASEALGLAKYYYVEEVLVSENVYRTLFPAAEF